MKKTRSCIHDVVQEIPYLVLTRFALNTYLIDYEYTKMISVHCTLRVKKKEKKTHDIRAILMT